MQQLSQQHSLLQQQMQQRRQQWGGQEWIITANLILPNTQHIYLDYLYIVDSSKKLLGWRPSLIISLEAIAIRLEAIATSNKKLLGKMNPCSSSPV